MDNENPAGPTESEMVAPPVWAVLALVVFWGVIIALVYSFCGSRL